ECHLTVPDVWKHQNAILRHTTVHNKQVYLIFHRDHSSESDNESTFVLTFDPTHIDYSKDVKSQIEQLKVNIYGFARSEDLPDYNYVFFSFRFINHFFSNVHI
ncbi:MAG: hypothetical protein VXY56_05590, partial [Pseudomonadota bacterium]|nr:hypothetical protein [Pseudomonadota bacterium]